MVKKEKSCFKFSCYKFSNQNMLEMFLLGVSYFFVPFSIKYSEDCMWTSLPSRFSTRRVRNYLSREKPEEKTKTKAWGFSS